MYEVKGMRYKVGGLKRGLCESNFILFTLYFLRFFRAAKVQLSRFQFSILNFQFSVYRNASTFAVVTSATCSMGHSKMSATFWAMMGT